AFPKLLILFCILAVFAPAFTMKGIPGALFYPLALAIAFSMITSYLLSQTFVPIMANWVMRTHHDEKHEGVDTHEELKSEHVEDEDTWDQKKMLLAKKGEDATRFEKFRDRFIRFLERIFPYRKAIVVVYVIVVTAGAVLFLNTI